MEDETTIDDEPIKRGPGRPPKPKDTPDTVMVWVRMVRKVTLADGSKTAKGEPWQATLREARKMVERGSAVWMDPRPDLDG